MKSFFLALGCAIAVEAHVGVFTDGMFCRGGNDGTDNQNTNLVVNPLYNMTRDQWWMQRDRGCDKVPPPEGEFLDLPAGGSFTVELAINRAFTTLSYGGGLVSDWPDGDDHPEDWAAPPGGECLMDNPDGAGGPMHTKSEEAAAGTAWAISYEKDLSAVTMENLVVFSVLEHTPWKRLATYEVPADLPACPEEGCYCAWLWVPDGCGEPNMYMQNFRCRVTNTSSTKKLGTAQVPVPCRDDPSACVTGPKQMIAWNQAEGNNVGNIGFSPAYNMRLGYRSGAQNDIFVESEAEEVEVVESATSSAVSSPTASEAVEAPESSSAEVVPVSSSVPSAVASSTESAAAQPTEAPVGEGHSECSSKKARRRRRARAARAARAAARL